MGPEAHGLPRAEAARGLLRLHGAEVDPRRSGEGARAPAEGGRSGDEVSHRARGRGIEAAGKAEAASRKARGAASAQGSSFGGAFGRSGDAGSARTSCGSFLNFVRRDQEKTNGR